jgi:hypothetical protein
VAMNCWGWVIATTATRCGETLTVTVAARARLPSKKKQSRVVAVFFTWPPEDDV